MSYEVVRDKATFFKKKKFAQEMEKLGQKWVKNRVFWIYWLWNMVPEIWTNMLLANQIEKFLNQFDL